MAINVTGVPPNSQSGAARSKTDNERVGDAQPQQTTPKERSQDGVQLSESMQALQAADKRLAETPEVDTQRVEALRAAIENGSYRIDYQRVAERLLDFEQSLD